MDSIRAVVPATEDNFDADAYIRMNPDVAAAGIDPRTHFRRFGLAEGRSQLNQDYVAHSAELRRRKFALFSPLLAFETSGLSSFPISAEGRHHEAADYEAESSNGESADLIQACRENPGQLYLNLGAGLSRNVFVNCLNVEVYPSLTTDLVVPPTCTYPIRDGAVDGIACLAVLEHTRKPWLVVSEMRRMLKRGGKVWIDWPFLQPVHGYPSHYYNATREGLRALFEDSGFEIDSIGTYPNQGFDHTFTWLLDELMRNLPDATRKRLAQMRMGDFLAQRPGGEFWDRLLAETGEQAKETLACGNSLVATKA